MTVMMADSDTPFSSVYQTHCPLPAPAMLPSYCPDPDLGLTPDKSPNQLNSKKTVRFISPNKSKARRRMELTGKENCVLSNIDLPSGSTAQGKPGGKANSRRQKSCKTQPKIERAVIPEHSVTVENHLDTPELHTTLNLGRDILQLQTMNIDIAEALKHRLTVSDKDRTEVKQKTYARLNERPKSPSAFGNAISVSTPGDLVIERTEKQLNKAVKPIPRKQKVDEGKPSLMKYFKPKLAFHRCVSLDQHGYQPRALQIRGPAVEQAVYEHHDRIAMWDSQ